MADKTFKGKITAKGTGITVLSQGTDDDYISLTDIAKYKNQEFPADIIKNWLRTRFTIDYLGAWEQLYNPNFKLVEFDQFKSEAGHRSREAAAFSSHGRKPMVSDPTIHVVRSEGPILFFEHQESVLRTSPVNGTVSLTMGLRPWLLKAAAPQLFSGGTLTNKEKT